MISKSLKSISSACIVAIILQVLFILTNNAYAQSKKNKTEVEVVKDVYKFLASESNITLLKSKEQYYTFNLRIELNKKGGKVKVSGLKFSNTIGYQIFPHYKNLEKFDYESIIGNNSHAVIMIPILVLNNPTDEKNPSDAISGINKNSLRELASSLLYPDLLQKNITLFPLFMISRADIQ